MPTLDAANIAFNLLKIAAGDGITLGPILLGAAKPVHILTPSATVRRIVNMTALTVVDCTMQRQPRCCSGDEARRPGRGERGLPSAAPTRAADNGRVRSRPRDEAAP